MSMKIILITYVTPTPDNYRAASALSYHLAMYRPNDVELEIYSFNGNGVPEEMIAEVGRYLGVDIHTVPTNRWINLLFETHTIFLKNFLPYPFAYYNVLPRQVVEQIKAKQADAIWVNGDFLSKVLRQFAWLPRVMTMPDCVSLYYKRLMQDDWCKLSWYRMIGSKLQMIKNTKMERHYPIRGVKYHLVGEEDRCCLLSINPNVDAYFIRHPHYNCIDRKRIGFSQPKIKILIAGQNNLYMHTAFMEVLLMLCQHPQLAQSYSLSFLGRGWERAVDKLAQCGFEVHHLGYVDVYLDEIVKYDIQLTPISVGTGTKGKVLDALANGLLVIGSSYAMENIAVENGVSCLIYHDMEELYAILCDIPNRRILYETVAQRGREEVLKWHGRKRVATDFFALFK